MPTQTILSSPNPPMLMCFSDLTRSSTTTLADDTILLFAMAANSTYYFELFVEHYADAGAFKYAISIPAGNTPRTIWRQSKTQTGTIVNVAENTPVGSTAVTSTGEFGYVWMKGTVMNGVNAGNFAFQWAQNSSSAQLTYRLAGSYLRYLKVV